MAALGSTTNIGASPLFFKTANIQLLKPSFSSNSRKRFVSNTRIVARRGRSPAYFFTYKRHVPVKAEGEPGTLEYRVFSVDNSGKKISPWHDIPLQSNDGTFNFICEMPKGTKAKMEMAPDEKFNPFKQVSKEEKLQIYPFPMDFNYGFFPQTWEDPSFEDPDVDGAPGDNHPIDVVEIGQRLGRTGQIMKVKPLCCFAMMDDGYQGRIDWKIVTIAVDDPEARRYNNHLDLEKYYRSVLDDVKDYWRWINVIYERPYNQCRLGDEPADKDYALKVIARTHESWRELVKGSIPDPSGEFWLG